MALLADRSQAGLRALRDVGYAPDSIIDVGAWEGTWTREMLPLFPAARFLMVEAQPAKLELLQKVADGGRIAYEIALLGPISRPAATFHIGGEGSSLYREQTAAVMQTVTLPMTTLDELAARYDLPGRVFLKLDVQGAELDVLAGAEAVLSRTDVVLLEASVVAYNVGAPRGCRCRRAAAGIGLPLVRRLGLAAHRPGTGADGFGVRAARLGGRSCRGRSSPAFRGEKRCPASMKLLSDEARVSLPEMIAVFGP